MPEVVVVGAFRANPGKEEEALEAFKALVEPTHGDEGYILYALHRGTDDPARLAFIERWESRELLDITVYEAVPAGELQKGSLVKHAGG